MESRAGSQMGVNNFHGDLTILLSLSWSRLVQSSSYMEGFFQQQENILHVNKPPLLEKASTAAGEGTARNTTWMLPPPRACRQHRTGLIKPEGASGDGEMSAGLSVMETASRVMRTHGAETAVQPHSHPELPPFSCWATRHRSAGAGGCPP